MEQKQSLVDLGKSVSGATLEVILHCIYTTELCLSLENAAEVATTADFLQVEAILPFCERFLYERVCVEKCAEFYQVAKALNMERTEVRAKDCFKRHFTEVVNTAGFKTLSLENLKELLTEDQLVLDAKEILVFRAVSLWLEDKCFMYLSKKQVDSLLTTCVCYIAIPADELLTEVSKNALFGIIKSRMKMVSEALRYQSELHKQPLMVLDYKRKKPRGEPCFVSVVVKEIKYKVSSNKKSRPRLVFQEMDKSAVLGETKFSCPLEPESVLCVTHGTGFIFALGEAAPKHTTVFLRYSLLTETWLKLDPPPWTDSHVQAMLAAGQRHIYLVGGLCEDGKRSDASYQYLIGGNKWETLPRMPAKLSSAGICAHSSGTVYVAGGYRCLAPNTHRVYTLYALNTETKTWARKAPMRFPRAGFSLVEACGSLFAMFGAKIPEDGSTGTVEEYHVVQDQWTIVEFSHLELSHLRFTEHCTSCVVDDRVVVSGVQRTCACVGKHDNVFLVEWEIGEQMKLIKTHSMPFPRNCDLFGVVTVRL